MLRALNQALLSLLLVATIFGCGKSIQIGTGNGNGNGGDIEKNKPGATDFTGSPGAFAGQWQGTCSYISNGIKNTNCTAALSLKQDTSSTYIMGALQYTIGYTVSAPAAIHRMEIDGNALKANGAVVGKIGKNALEFYDASFGDFSILRFGSEMIGINAMQMPTFELSPAFSVEFGADIASAAIPADCSTTFCFSATLQKAH